GDVTELAQAVKILASPAPHSCRDAVRHEVADAFDRVETEAGSVWVAFSNDGIRMIATGDSIDDLRSSYAKRYCRALTPGSIPDALRRQVVAALSGEGVSTPKVDLEVTSELVQDVLAMLSMIPRGEVSTLYRIARLVGSQ